MSATLSFYLSRGGSRPAPVAQPPVAVGDSRNILADETTVPVNVLANDLHVAGAAVTIPTPATGADAAVVGSAIHVTRIGTAAGSYSLTYRATTAHGSSDAILSGTIEAALVEPSAVADTRDLTTTELSVLVDVLANDSNVAGGEVTIPEAATGATATVEPDNRIWVARLSADAGSYSLTYRVTTDGGFDEAVLSGDIAAYLQTEMPSFDGTTASPGDPMPMFDGTTASPGAAMPAYEGTSSSKAVFLDIGSVGIAGVDTDLAMTALLDVGEAAVASADLGTSLLAGFFLSTTGDDDNPGTEAEPFGTLAFAMGQLSAGDTLYLRGGTYRLASAFTWTKSGTVGSRVTVASYPGEVAVLDANLAIFQTTGQAAWTVHDAGTATYRSAASYSSPTNWIGSIIIGGVLYRLLRYETLTALMSTTYTWQSSGEYYRGPGFIVHTDGRIYVRLQNLASPRDAGVPAAAPAGAAIRNTPPSAGGFDPNTFVINLSPVGQENQSTSVLFTISASNLTFERLSFHGADRGVLMDGRSNITFQNCRMQGQRVIIRFEAGNDNIQVLNGEFDTGVPPWIAWAEIKDDEANHPAMKMSLSTIDINNTNILFQDNLIRSVFDGLATPGTGCDNIRFLNNTWGLLIDDAVQFKGNLTNLEFAYNYVNGPGPGYDGSASSSAATKWFHHNIIDVRRDEFGWRNGHNADGPAWRDGHIAFATHSASGNMPAKIYNNTILYVSTHNNDGCRIERQGAKTSGLHEAYNNIVIGYGAHSYIRGVDVSATSQILDYQIIHNFGSYVASQAFREWPDGAGQPTTHYADLATWLASTGFTASQAVYAPGFEANSKQINPQLRDPDAGDYRPNAAAAATGAKDLSATGWPGATNASWFGAVDPNAVTGLGNVGHRGTAGP